MRNARAIVERNPLISFFVLAYGLTWPVIPLVSVSPLLGLPGLFGPALAAIIVASLAEGKSGLKNLLSRLMRWRIGALVRCSAGPARGPRLHDGGRASSTRWVARRPSGSVGCRF